jgi:hypothetical protein
VHYSVSKLASNKLRIGLGAERLWSLNGHADGTIDDELGKHAEGTGNSKQNGVVVGLGETIILQENSAVGVDVGVWVLGLSVLGENAGGNLVDLGNKLEHGIVRQMLQCKLSLRDVARIGLAEDGVAIAGDDLPSLESGPEIVLDGLITKIVTNRLLHLLEPEENFLVSPGRIISEVDNKQIMGVKTYSP